MTASQIKVRIQRRPTLKLKVLPKFPGNVSVESPITLDRTGGAYNFGLDLNAIKSNLEPFFPPILHFDMVYAELFGVSPLNSAAANDVAFASLITSLGAGGKRVVLPHGKIQISSTLALTGLKNVIFEGKGSLDLTYSGDFGTVLCFIGAGSGSIVDMQDHRGVWWRDVQVVYTSNSFTGTVFNCASSFSTGNGSGFENVQVYQITNNGHTAAQCWYLKNCVDMTFRNCYASHANFGWLGLSSGDVGETNMIKLYGCTSIGLVTAAIVNPVIGWTLYGHNFEIGDAGIPAGIITSGTFDIKDLGLFGCKFADSTANGTWINFSNNTFNFTMIGGDILAQSGTVTGILFNGTFHACPTIIGVLFSDLSIGINFNASVTGATVLSNEFLNTPTPISSPSNLDAGSLCMANSPGTANVPIKAGYGGTGLQSYTIGDILYANGTGTFGKLSDIATGNALISGGVGVAPSWGKIELSTHIAGTLGVANGGTGVTTSTGSGSVVLSTSPALVTPVLGVASATSVNKVAITAPATGATLTVADGKTLTANNSLTLSGTDATVMTFPSVSATLAGIAIANTWTATQTITATNPLTINGSPSTFKTTAAGGDVAAVRYNTNAAGETVGFGFQDAGSTKWTFSKASTNNLRIQDFANSTYVFDATPGTASTGGVNTDFSWRFLTNTAIPAGGTAGMGLKLSTTANFGVFFGSGAPTLSAAKGSLYLRSDGSSTSTRMYVNTDGATTWTNVTTAA